MDAQNLSSLSAPRVEASVAATRAAFVKSRQRSGFSNIVLKLSVYGYEDQLVGHHYTWVNDTPGNVASFIKRGYSHVLKSISGKIGDHSKDMNNDVGSVVSQFVGKDQTGQPMRGYLLKIPLGWYDEDQELFIANGRKYDDEIRGGKALELNNEQGLEYRVKEKQYSNGTFVYR